MSNPLAFGNRFYSVSAIAIGVALTVPLVLLMSDIFSGYSELKETKFRTKKILQQQHVSKARLTDAEKHLLTAKKDLKPLIGTSAQAGARLQSTLTALIEHAGGTVDTISLSNTAVSPDTLRKVSTNVRWNGDIKSLAQVMKTLASDEQNLVVESINLRRRHGASEMIDIRMQISALFTSNDKVSGAGQ